MNGIFKSYISRLASLVILVCIYVFWQSMGIIKLIKLTYTRCFVLVTFACIGMKYLDIDSTFFLKQTVEY